MKKAIMALTMVMIVGMCVLSTLPVSANAPGSSFETAIPLTPAVFQEDETVFHRGNFANMEQEIFFTFTTGNAGTYAVFSDQGDIVRWRLYDWNFTPMGSPHRPRLRAESTYYVVMRSNQAYDHMFVNNNTFSIAVQDRTSTDAGLLAGVHWHWWAVLGVIILLTMRKTFFGLFRGIYNTITAIGRPKIKPESVYAPTKAKPLFLLGGGLFTLFGAVILINNLMVLETLVPLEQLGHAVSYWDRIFRVMVIVMPVLWIISGLQNICYCLFGSTRPWMYGLMNISTQVILFSPYIVGSFLATSTSLVPFTENLYGWFPFLAQDGGGLNLTLLWMIIVIGQICYVALEWVERDFDYYNGEEQASVPAFVFKIVTRFIMIGTAVWLYVPHAANYSAMAPLALAYGIYMLWTTVEWWLHNMTYFGMEGIKKTVGDILKMRIIFAVIAAVWYFISSIIIFPVLVFVSNLSPTIQAVVCIYLTILFFQPKTLLSIGGTTTVKGTDGRTYVSDPNGNFTCAGYPGQRFRLK